MEFGWEWERMELSSDHTDDKVSTPLSEDMGWILFSRNESSPYWDLRLPVRMLGCSLLTSPLFRRASLCFGGAPIFEWRVFSLCTLAPFRDQGMKLCLLIGVVFLLNSGSLWGPLNGRICLIFFALYEGFVP